MRELCTRCGKNQRQGPGKGDSGSSGRRESLGFFSNCNEGILKLLFNTVATIHM